MLDRLLIVKELSERTGKICAGRKQELQTSIELIHQNIHLTEIPQGTFIPRWKGHFGISKKMNSIEQYDVIATDGSQIYPDRHQGIECFLINVGSIFLHYSTNSSVQFFSEPFITLDGEGSEIISPHMIDCKRSEMEFAMGVKLMERTTQKALFMCDGSLIFWHLQSPQNENELAILQRYFILFEQFRTKQFPLMGYISLPKSKDLLQVLSALSGISFNYIADLDVIPFFIPPGSRTQFFESTAPVTQFYPPDHKPFFCYINTGQEIARIELPAWIVMNDSLADEVIAIAYDQVQKGLGYPVALAEAHEQAVVSHADRDFFYQTLQRLAENYDQYYIPSQKSTKKRGMSF